MSDAKDKLLAKPIVRNVHISYASFASLNNTFTKPLTLKNTVKVKSECAEEMHTSSESQHQQNPPTHKHDS
jgi:hypothetical protein